MKKITWGKYTIINSMMYNGNSGNTSLRINMTPLSLLIRFVCFGALHSKFVERFRIYLIYSVGIIRTLIGLRIRRNTISLSIYNLSYRGLKIKFVL